ncbi:MAG: TonB-dependent receptor [Dokdonella sp.]|uniref:TonB-dependent receptor n=1 Tax=Dokdonella sp. TaxID=2291710 RepID=UPI003F7F94F9
MPIHRLALAICAGLVLSTPSTHAAPAAPADGAADTGKDAATPPDAELGGAKPKVDRETLPTVVVNALPGAQRADQVVAPVSVLSGAELDDARAGTIGQTVSNVPGVQSTSFGQGVGRPVIRGFDGPRVSVLSNGLGSEDVSNVSQDHAVTVEPFLADQIEILKGPATLLYGSGAIGGIVNVVDGRIPTAIPPDGVSGRVQVGYDSVSDGRSEVFRVDAGGNGFALHADGLDRRDHDYDVPGATLPNSYVHTNAGAIGGSAIGDWGHLGVSVSRYLDTYGNPAEPGDAATGEAPVHLQMAQTRYDLEGAINAPFTGIDKLEFDLGHTDYQHVEFEGDVPGTTFSNDADEGRLLLTHAPLASWSGAFGVQAFRRDFAAVGDETFVPPTSTRGLGVFMTERRDLGALGVELGARVDRQGSTPEGASERDFHPVSLSAGFAWRIDDAWHLSFNLDRAQRAPAEEELFANGPHDASATFEVGNPTLHVETANQAELGLHWHGERVEAKVAVYANRYDDFIYLADTGLVEDDLPVRDWSQANARFRGGEAEATVHLAKNASGDYDLRVWGDTVRATLENGGNLPRIPAARVGSELSWRNDRWRTSVGATRYFAQDDTAVFETSTDGFTLVNAHVAFSFFADDRSSWEVFLDGNNLANQTARLSTSLIKDAAPLPGRNVSIGVRGLF